MATELRSLTHHSNQTASLAHYCQGQILEKYTYTHMYRADKPSRDYATQIRSYVMPRPIRPQYQSTVLITTKITCTYPKKQLFKK